MNAQQLKNSILQMAVQGKLVPQDPNDEPASALLERIRAEKEQLIKEGKIKKEKNPSRIFRGADNLPYEQIGKNEPVCIADEVPFEIPESWEWVRLKTICSLLGGYAFKSMQYKSNGIRVIRISDFNESGLVDADCKYYTEDEALSNYIIKKDDILLCMTGGTVGKTCLLEHEIDKMYLNQRVACIRRISKAINLTYLYINVISPYTKKVINSSKTSTNDNISMDKISDFYIPIPPINEQIRIIEKLNELQPFISNYSYSEESLDKLNCSFPESIKKSILQEAVMGKLVPQDPNDEPASVLLERIRAEKEQLIKAGKIKRDKHESIIFRRDNSHYEKCGSEEICIDDEIPFDIPESWSWSRIGSLVQVNPRNNLSDDLEVGFMPMTLLQDGFNSSHTSETRVWKDIKSGFTHFADGDVAIAKITPCFQNRKSVVLHDLPNGYGAGTTELHVLRDNTSMFYMEYLLLICKTHDFISTGVRNFSGTAGQQRIGKEFVSNYLIPIPPVKEQKRIVNTVLEVISKIDQLFG